MNTNLALLMFSVSLYCVTNNFDEFSPDGMEKHRTTVVKTNHMIRYTLEGQEFLCTNTVGFSTNYSRWVFRQVPLKPMPIPVPPMPQMPRRCNTNCPP